MNYQIQLTVRVTLCIAASPVRAAGLRGAYVSAHVQKCAGVVHVQDHGNVCWSVHRGRARACARARVCMCAAQGLPGEPTHAGNGSPVPELWNYRTLPRARGPPPCVHCSQSFFHPVIV